MPRVAVTTGDHRRDNVRRALEGVEAELAGRLQQARTILVKVNLVHHTKQLSSTHVDAVRGVLDFVRTKTQAPVIVADASYHGTKAAFQNFGYENLVGEYQNLKLLDLNDDATVSGFYVKRDGSKGVMAFSKTAVEADVTVSLAPMKTHRDTGVTLSVKNWAVGTWVAEPQFGPSGKFWPRWPFLHEEGAWAHHMSIAELYGQHKPTVAVLDGFQAMEGDGPTRGEVLPMHIALAGTDAVAVDAVACRLMGIDPSEIGYLVFAAEKGYGTMDEQGIEVASDRPLPELAKTVKRPPQWDEHALAWRDRGNLKFELPT